MSVGAVREEDTEQPAVGDGAAARDRQPLGAVPGPHPTGDAIPHDAGPQLAELLAGVATGQQVEHGVEHIVGEVGVARAAPHHGREVVDGDLLHRGDGHDLLRQHVERVAEVAGLLDEAVTHPLGDDRRLQQVAPVLGEKLAAAGLAHRVAGPADALQAATDRTR